MRGSACARSDYVLSAQVTDEELASHLNVGIGTALLATTAVTYDAGNSPFELSHTWFLGDRYRFHTTLFRRAPKSPAHTARGTG
jgi:DNA-binding GntR family transcriptional regulator